LTLSASFPLGKTCILADISVGREMSKNVMLACTTQNQWVNGLQCQIMGKDGPVYTLIQKSAASDDDNTRRYAKTTQTPRAYWPIPWIPLKVPGILHNMGGM
jgi:hypothetical protein